MEWSPEEKARRAELARMREEKIIKERSERQRRLQEYDQDVSQQRSSTPTNFEPAGEFVMPEGNYGDKAQGLFGWANNNPSSKNAIYDLEFINSKAGGGNVGEMMTELRGKGRTEESREVLVPGAMKNGRDMRIYYREMGAPREGEAPKPAVVMVHGVLDHSWSWRELMRLAAKEGLHAFAPDMPGSGYSAWPQPGMDFDYGEKEIKGVFSKWLDAVGLGQQRVTVVVQGFVYSQYALLWALENPTRVERIVVLNCPITPGTKLPLTLTQYKLPIVSAFVAQDAMRAERFLEGGNAYALTVEDADRYREPFLESMMPGLAVEDAVKRCDWDRTLSSTYAKLQQAGVDVVVSWGAEDKYLPAADAEGTCKALGLKFAPVRGKAGFMPQVDYAESALAAIRPFLLAASRPAAAPVLATAAAATATTAAGGAPSAAGGLPAGWAAAADPESGRTYYYNAGTGESRWTPPE